MKHRYFVAYMASNLEGSIAYRSCEVCLKNPVRGFDDINLIVQIIKEKDACENITVLSYQKFESLCVAH